MPINDELTGPRQVDLKWDDSQLIGGKSSITEAILSVNVSYSMDITSQVTVEVHDPDFELANSNYFAIARTVWYRSFTHSGLDKPAGTVFEENSRIWYRMEVASATMGPGPGVGAVWTVMLRPKGVQQLKRNRDPSTIGGLGGSAFIEAAAAWAGLSSSGTVQYTTEAGGNWQADAEKKESAWDVMTRIASGSAKKDEQTRFMLFETDNTLFFGTQRWLLGRWGMEFDANVEISPGTTGIKRSGMNFIHMAYPPMLADAGSLDVFRMMALPRMTRSDNNPLEVQGSVQLDRFNARALRPGMTIMIDLARRFCALPNPAAAHGTDYFNGYYLISQVSFDHYGTGPVSISFRSPERIAKDIDPGQPGRLFTATENSTVRL